MNVNVISAFILAVVGIGYLFGLPGYLLLRRFGLRSTGETVWLGTVTMIMIEPLWWFVWVQVLHQPLNWAVYVSTPLVIVLGLVIWHIWQRQPISWTFDWSRWWQTNWPLGIWALLFIALHGYTISQTVVIDSGDSNYFLNATKVLQDTGVLQRPFERPLFKLLLSGLSTVTTVSPYDWFRWGMPLLSGCFFYPCYLLLKRLVSQPTLRFLGLMMLLAIPNLTLTLDTIRPENIFLLGLPTFIYCLGRAFETKKPLYLVIAGMIASIGVLYYELFFLLALFFFVAIIVWFRSVIRQHPMLWLLRSGWVALTLYPYIKYFRFITLTFEILKSFWERLAGGTHWYWWFLNHYESIAGDAMGWPGVWGAVQYYSYYLSPLLGIILLVWLWRGKWLWRTLPAWLRSYVMISLGIMGIFLIVAEVLPRIGLNYLPERAWLFIDIGLLMLGILWLSSWRMSSVIVRRTSTVIVSILIIIGLVGAIGIAHARQGLISRGELTAAEYLENHSDPTDIVITQEGNAVLFEDYGNRRAETPPENFFTSSTFTAPDQDFLNSLTSLEDAALRKDTVVTRDNFSKAYSDFFTAPLDEHASRSFMQASREYQAAVKKFEDDRLARHQQQPHHIFIAYSYDKLHHLLKERPYFQKENFFDATLSKFNNDKFEVIYNSPSMIIWKIKL